MPNRCSASGRSGTAAMITRAASGWKGRNTREIATLKKVWALAIWRAGSAELAATSVTNGSRNGSTIATPRSLKPTWAAATRRASVDEPSEAVRAVTQVPMLAPRTSGSALGRVRSPCDASASTRPIVAAEDATRAAKAAEAATPRSGVSAKASSAWATIAVLERLHPLDHQLQPEEDQAEPEDGVAQVLQEPPLPEEGHREAEPDQQERVVVDAERQQLDGEGRPDVGAQDDAHRLVEGEKPRLDESDHHDRRRRRRLDQRGRERARQEGREAIRGQVRQHLAEAGAGEPLEPVPGVLHPVEEERHPAEQDDQEPRGHGATITGPTSRR